MNPIIRRAQIEDAAGIAQVHVASWRTTYAGIIDDQVLNEISVAQRTREREIRLAFPPPGVVTYVAEIDEKIVGFATGGRERRESSVYTGELFAIYLLQAYQRLGIGRQLVQAVATVVHNQIDHIQVSPDHVHELAHSDRRSIAIARNTKVHQIAVREIRTRRDRWHTSVNRVKPVRIGEKIGGCLGRAANT